QSLLGRRQLRTIIAARKQVAVAIRRHLDRGVPEAALHQLEWEFEAAIDAPVDAPASIEVAQRMQAAVLGSSPCVDYARTDLGRSVGAIDDSRPIVGIATSVREREIVFTLRAGELPLS